MRSVLRRPGLFLNSSSDARLLRPILEAQPPAGRRADEEMAADVAQQQIQPLFDGPELERI